MKENNEQVISFVPKRSVRGPKNGQRVKNTLKVYILTTIAANSDNPKTDIKWLSELLNVDTRTIYRYLKVIKEVKNEIEPLLRGKK